MTAPNPASIGRLARARFSGALISDSKWRKLISVISEQCSEIESLTVKFIDVEGPKALRFPPSLTAPHAFIDTIEFGPVDFRSIEWIEFSGDVQTSLAGRGHFPMKLYEGHTRVQGYVA